MRIVGWGTGCFRKESRSSRQSSNSYDLYERGQIPEDIVTSGQVRWDLRLPAPDSEKKNPANFIKDVSRFESANAVAMRARGGVPSSKSCALLSTASKYAASLSSPSMVGPIGTPALRLLSIESGQMRAQRGASLTAD
jgi:hypothetical protein